MPFFGQIRQKTVNLTPDLGTSPHYSQNVKAKEFFRESEQP
jgi:hypothetical protein